MNACAYIEIARPKGWAQTLGFSSVLVCPVFSHRERDTDYIEVEAEAVGRFWVDNCYGADADGNRGARMAGYEIDDITFRFDAVVKPRGLWMRFVDFLRGTRRLPRHVVLREKDLAPEEIREATELLQELFLEMAGDPEPEPQREYWE